MTGLNRLRTAYVHAPNWLRKAVSPLLAAVPERYRFGGTYVAFRKHIERSRHDADFTHGWQRDKLRSLLQAAHARAPYYSKVFEACGLTADRIGRFQPEDISRLPTLSKEYLRQSAPEEFLTVPAASLDIVSTSGSSGTPLAFHLDKDRSAKEWAFVLDAWAKIGFSARNTRAVFRGLHLTNVDETPWEYEPALGELRLSPFHLNDRWMAVYCDLIKRYGATYLHGYPSALSIFANYVKRNGRQDIASLISGIICASEATFPHQRQLLEEVFGTDAILSFYGMSEKVAFGSEVPGSPGVFEMEPLYGITELLDDHDRPISTQGEKGRIVATGLLFKGMPFIRYDTGDMAELVEPASPANCFRLKLRNIGSRWGQEFLVGNDGRLISMTAINIHSPAYSRMAGFQFHQEVPGEASLKAVLAPGCTEADLVPFIAEISEKIGSSLKFNIEIVDALPANTRGKSKFIDQKIDLSGL